MQFCNKASTRQVYYEGKEKGQAKRGGFLTKNRQTSLRIRCTD